MIHRLFATMGLSGTYMKIDTFAPSLFQQTKPFPFESRFVRQGRHSSRGGKLSWLAVICRWGVVIVSYSYGEYRKSGGPRENTGKTWAHGNWQGLNF